MQNLFFHIFLNAKKGDQNKFHKYTYYLTEIKLIFPLFYCIHVVVNFLSQVIFIFLLFLDMIMYANEV